MIDSVSRHWADKERAVKVAKRRSPNSKGKVIPLQARCGPDGG